MKQSFTPDFKIEQFESIHELQSVLSKRSPNSVFDGKRSSHNDDFSFTGTRSYEEAERLMLTGWSEYVEEIKRSSLELKTANSSTDYIQRKMPRNAVVGYAPHIPNSILGLPESMITTDNSPKKCKVISIFYVPCACGGTSSETYKKAGIKLLALINKLELAGYRVNLRAAFKSSIEDEEGVCGTVVIKNWRQPLDLSLVSFALAHASFQRRIGFNWLETLPELRERGWRFGYGCTIEVHDSDYERCKTIYKDNGVLEKNEFYISLQLIENCDFDIKEVAKRCGMADVISL